jgi:predicted transcriptional regulator
MTLKEMIVKYCTEINESLQKINDAKTSMDLFLGEDDKRREAFKVMVEFDPVIKELFEQMEELTDKLEM